MATKKVKTDKKGAKTAKKVDPFAVKVESLTASASPEKPKRAIKVIKAAKLINAARGPGTSDVPSTRASTDAFAEIAAPTPKSEEVTPRFTADVADTKNIKARTTKEIEKLFGPKVGKAETVSTPDGPLGKKTKVSALKKNRPAVVRALMFLVSA